VLVVLLVQVVQVEQGLAVLAALAVQAVDLKLTEIQVVKAELVIQVQASMVVVV
jgi:hypothetical protein